MAQSSALSFDELPRGAGGTGATEQIAQVLQSSGLDVPNALYDESLALAREGRLTPAAERLRMLMVLDPGDGEAALLLGKVLAARAQWQESLSWLDAAAAKGVLPPNSLRDQVEAGLKAQIFDSEATRDKAVQRDKGEVRNLRAEAKKLRADNAALEMQVEELGRRVKWWSSATALVAGSASALLLASLLFGGPSEDEGQLASAAHAPVAERSSSVPAPAAAPVEIPTMAPVEVPVGAAPVEQPAAAPVSGITEVAVKPPTMGGVAPAPGSLTPVSPGKEPTAVKVEKPLDATPSLGDAKSAAARDNAGARPSVPSEGNSASKVPSKKSEPPKVSSKNTKPVVKTKGTTHTVKSGETLGSMASKYYGNSAEWPRILKANPSLKGSPKNLQPGMKLTIPSK